MNFYVVEWSENIESAVDDDGVKSIQYNSERMLWNKLLIIKKKSPIYTNEKEYSSIHL